MIYGISINLSSGRSNISTSQAQQLYDWLFDHHRQNGADIQLDEMEPLGFDPNDLSSKLCLVTTQVDADAIAQPYWESLQANTQKIIEQQRIREYRNCLIFNPHSAPQLSHYPLASIQIRGGATWQN